MIEDAVAVALAGFACICALRGWALLRFRLPARATIVFDGYRTDLRERRAASMSAENEEVPFMADDLIAFRTDGGREMRVTVRHMGFADTSPTIWYDRRDPVRVTTLGPGTWFCWTVANLVTLAWLLS